MTVKFDKKEVDSKMDKNIKKFLQSAGELTQNQIVFLAPVQSGLLRNSISYYVEDGKKGKLNTYGGETKATEDDRVSKPDKQYTVRIGSGLIYADSVEAGGTTKVKYNTDSAHFMQRSFDELVAAKAFENLMGKIVQI